MRYTITFSVLSIFFPYSRTKMRYEHHRSTVETYRQFRSKKECIRSPKEGLYTRPSLPLRASIDHGHMILANSLVMHVGENVSVGKRAALTFWLTDCLFVSMPQCQRVCWRPASQMHCCGHLPSSMDKHEITSSSEHTLVKMSLCFLIVSQVIVR